MEIDPVLKEIIDFVEEYNQEIKIKLLIDGILHQGSLISALSYLKIIKEISEDLYKKDLKNHKNLPENKQISSRSNLAAEQIERDFVQPEESKGLLSGRIESILENQMAEANKYDYIHLKTDSKSQNPNIVLRIKTNLIGGIVVIISD